jgi:hypothetical protein
MVSGKSMMKVTRQELETVKFRLILLSFKGDFILKQTMNGKTNGNEQVRTCESGIIQDTVSKTNITGR